MAGRMLEIEIGGLAELQRLFDTLPARTRAESAKALNYSAILIQRQAREEAPIDQGQLRSSIGITKLADAVVIRPTAKHALYVHEGTGIYGPSKKRFLGKITALAGTYGAADKGWRWIKGQKSNHYMDRALERALPGINAAFDQAIKNIIGGK